MELKWCGGILIMLGSVCVGVWFRMQYLQRLDTIKEMQRGVTLLKGEIQYGRSPLPEACMAVSLRVRGSCKVFFQQISEKLQTGGGTAQQIWHETMQDVFEQRQFNARDYDEINRLGNTLGYLDVDLQVRTLELCITRLEDSISCYEKERKNQTRLYPMIGTFGGFLLCLVLI